MATTSFLLLFVGAGPIGLVFAVLGLSAARRGLATNRGLAVGSLVLNLVATVALFLIVVDPWDDRGRAQYADISVGECVKEPKGWTDEGGVLSTDYVARAACDGKHWGQVYFRGELRGIPYPGDDATAAKADDLCYSEPALANLDQAFADQAFISYVLPTAQSWAALDRSVICLASNQNNNASESWVVEP